MKKPLQEILKELDSVVEEYQGGAGVTRNDLMRMQRSLSTNTYWITKVNIEAFQNWNSLVHKFSGSNAAGQTYANEEVPELRLTRKLLEAAKNVQIAISNELGIMKNE